MNIVYWGSLLGLVLLQIALGLAAWRYLARRLRAISEAQEQTANAAHVYTSMSALVAGLARVEARMQQLERAQPAPPPPQPQQQSDDRAYQLAQRMARDGAAAAQIAESCGIAMHEAELLTRLHAHAR